jgi:hypothetical protein
MVRCLICLRSRDPYKHNTGRGDSPPAKAKKWLLKTCPNAHLIISGTGERLCQLTYRAGIDPRLAKLVGISEPVAAPGREGEKP